MSRLYLRFYLALLGSLVAFAVIMVLIWHRPGGPGEQSFDRLGFFMQNALPAADAPAAEQQAALRVLATGLKADMALLTADRAPIASVGEPIPAGDESSNRGGHSIQHKNKAVWTIHLPDGRQLLANVPTDMGHPVQALLATLILLALVVAVAAYPIVRRLSKRLERLQHGVESLGAGDLSARVAVEGKDEIARLADSFNRSAGRIESLVGAHKSLLANASHELRTPLTRIRLALELMKDSADPKRRAGIDSDIGELDTLIDEILLASRLDALTELELDEPIDLLALAAEECARYDEASLDGHSVVLHGDPRLLRRLLRNLLENARRHGIAPTQVNIGENEQNAQISVSDRGPGVAADQRERVFEPFYRNATASSTGVGLGLALVRQIARRHGGEARCIGDASGGGSVFIVELPKRGAAKSA